MKKQLLTLLTLIVFGSGANAQIVNIPDANFKAYLLGNATINTNADAEIQVSEAAAYTGMIICEAQGISDLTGIEAFTSITQIHCSGNSITNIDASQNLSIVQLTCSGNNITSLNVSQNSVLYYLECNGNQLTSLDVTNNPNLATLNCTSNQISSLDVTQNPALINLLISENSISSLDLTNNTLLVNLFSYTNQLASINTAQNTALEILDCADNQIVDLDVSQNTALTKLYANVNDLNSLNAANGNNTNFSTFYASNNPNLICIQVDDAAWSTTNWTNIDAAASFSTDCSACIVNIPDAALKNNLVGNTLINTNSDTEIQCSEAAAFTGEINCAGLGVADLTGIEAFTALTELSCWGNSLTSIDLSQNTDLTFLNCNTNSLSSLDVTNNTSLTYLNFSQNSIAAIDLSQNSLLEDLHCAVNSIASLDLSSLNSLDWLNCRDNQLSVLDLSANTALVELYSENNSIVSLDLTANTNLELLWCSDNALTTLFVNNGNNANMINATFFKATNNPGLSCIQVDDSAWSTANWTNIDAVASFDENCAGAGINEANQTSMALYPNPASSHITIDTEDMIESIQIFDMSGSVVQSETTKTFSIAGLSTGIYTVNILTNNGLAHSRFIKK